MSAPYLEGSIETGVGLVPRAATTLSSADVLGTWKARWTIGRDDYKVAPGLYALGDPTPDSPVLVTSNYKMTFDVLRRDAAGIDAWLLVLDTHGINVWCAAGKGTFGSKELVTRLRASRLAEVVSHRTLVLPQLGAVGVAAHEIRLATGFRVVYGPVRSRDLAAFLSEGMRATPEMRSVTFRLSERVTLVPVELVNAAKPLLGAALAAIVLAALLGRSLDLSLAASRAVTALYLLGFGMLGGAVIGPMLLPWLPGRAFSGKGALVGALLGGAAAALQGSGPMSAAALTLGTAALASYLTMNFTGSTPFTSLSGVDREMRRWLPLQIGGGVVAALLAIATWLLEKGA